MCYSTMSDLTLSTGSASEEGIVIKGQINTRSGIVLGAGACSWNGNIHFSSASHTLGHWLIVSTAVNAPLL